MNTISEKYCHLYVLLEEVKIGIEWMYWVHIYSVIKSRSKQTSKLLKKSVSFHFTKLDMSTDRLKSMAFNKPYFKGHMPCFVSNFYFQCWNQKVALFFTLSLEASSICTLYWLTTVMTLLVSGFCAACWNLADDLWSKTSFFCGITRASSTYYGQCARKSSLS